ncbi:MAG: endonuclease/exonuclease/phosphatase family protein [Verrucomicrobiae bacterium]|nr:endonuclease/exonuclease/phosphatase family protein [Verrucomicrobiae bacterium]MDW8309776.1 endonuclease/exonuclease/phosphatase family protein [Verrucomicrobiales bacterium]
MHHGRVSKEIAAGLLALKKRIAAAKIPSSKLDETLNIATWNIREFGKARRSEAAIHYLAEILGQFDLIGIVELRDDLTDLGRVLKILGPYWRAVYSDMIPDAGGNRERLGFIYDKRAVVFNGLAAEANAPRARRGFEYLPEKSFWRAPYMASFRSGNFDFIVLSVHVRWGESLEARRQELEMLADWIEAKRREKTNEDKDLIVMGDFNIPSRNDPLFRAITKHGLQIPRALLGAHGTNLEKDKRYDQILHYPIYPENFSNAGGELDFFISEAHIAELFPGGMTKEKFTYQLSDHLPLWMQVRTDIDGQRLEQIIQG